MIRHDACPDANRHLLRATFDAGADGYDAVRPVAPPEVFDELVELARLAPGSRVLEIGCGTGQATLPLAERGCSILAVELGANLADFARRKLAAYPDVAIVTSSFEDWDPGDELFGSGTSTLACPSLPRRDLIETDQRWFRSVTGQLRSEHLANVDLRLVEGS